MIEPHELKNKQFSKVMRGYSQTEVDEHIEFVIEEYTKLYRENDELSRKLSEAEALLEAYRKDEESIRSALMSAQRASARIINDANDRADELLKATKLDCEKVLAEFRVDVGEERKKLVALKKAITEYKAGVYSKYMKHIEYLEQISPDYDLGELDLSEEEIAASDEGYVRRVLEDVKADLAEAAARREAENERRMAESRSGVEAALNQMESVQPVDPGYYSDSAAESEPASPDAGIGDAAEPEIPAAPEEYQPEIPEKQEIEQETDAGTGFTPAESVQAEEAPTADSFNDQDVFNDAPSGAADADTSDDSGFLSGIDLSNIGDATESPALEDSVPAFDETKPNEEPQPEETAPTADRKAKKADRNSVRATIEELNRKFRGQTSDADREIEEALRKLEDSEKK